MATNKRTDNKGRILRTGEMQRSEDGRYIYRYTDIIGRRKSVYATSLQELREKERQLQRDLEEGIDTAGGEMTLNQLFKIYMSTKTNIRPGTKKNYMAIWRNDIESSNIGEMQIKNIKAAHISALYAGFAERGLCEGTVRGIHNLLHSTLELAVDSDMIRKNPTKNCGKYISGGKHKRDALTRDEQAEFLGYIKNSNIYKIYYPMTVFLLNTGLRVSEFCGLRWEDVDLKNNMVHIRRQLIYQNYGDGCKYHLTGLKTENAERDIPLTHDAKEALLNQRKLDLLSGIQRNEVEGVSDYVFINAKGNPWNSTEIDYVFRRAVQTHNKKNNMGLPMISAHILRHTFASRCFESGLDTKTLQVVLGHSDISTTLNIYVQMDEKEIQKKFHDAESAMKVG